MDVVSARTDIEQVGQVEDLLEHMLTEFLASRVLWVLRRETSNVDDTGPCAWRCLKANYRKVYLGKRFARYLTKFWVAVGFIRAHLISQQRTITLREMYYNLEHVFQSPSQLAEILYDICGMLRIPRYMLGIVSSPRGSVLGPLEFLSPHGRVLFQCREHPLSISHRLVGVGEIRYRSTARFILVVEKEAVFQRLAETQICQRLNCILITGQGVPSLDTRRFLSVLSKTLQLPALGLFDLNPSGCAILMIYKLGSARSGIESSLYCTDLLWLGLRWEDLESRQLTLPDTVFAEFTPRDTSICHMLLQYSYVERNPLYHAAIATMLQRQRKAELESLNQLEFDYLANTFLPYKILFHQYF